MLITPVRLTFAAEPIIIDSKHYSNVFGEIRNFRIFLPPAYYDDPGKRFPVIYYYHGWSQRYFGSTSVQGADEGESNNGDNIANFVASNDVIVVKPDGYNRKPQEEYYLRPYNISPVETYRQYPLYFPELVNYIDANFRTIPNRDHRAISGLSMGGFMTFWISGKYPHLVSAAGSFCGSAEFFVGPADFPVEYRHIDLAKNYEGLNVRLNFGNNDFIRCYHRDMNRVWPQLMDNYVFKVYEAEHTTCGLGEMFEFIMDTFKNPPGKPEKWNHIDVYPEFDVWDYQVSTDRERPGFTILENVDEKGFRCSVREFLPNGELMPYVRLTVTTAPVYEKNQLYVVNDFDILSYKTTRKNVKSDSSGRLKIETDGTSHEIGINKTNDSPILCMVSAGILNLPWATPGKETGMKIRLLNKGLNSAGDVKAVLSSTRNGTRVLQNTSSFGSIDTGVIKEGAGSFKFIVSPDTVEVVKFKLTISDGRKNEWTEYFEIPARRDPPEIQEFEIADGRTFKVASAGTDTSTLLLGTGNGDGIANPGESLVILVKDQGLYRRTELVTGDPYINQDGINTRMSDNWSPYDHVGGSQKYSVPLVSSECPQNHLVEFLVSYWLPAYPDHIIVQGKIRVKVTGKDNTPPVIRWANVSGDNTVQVRAFDGSVIKQVRIRFTEKDDPERTIEALLNDDGREGDRSANDRLFSKKIPEQKFGQFKMEIEAIDSFGNKENVKRDGLYVLH